MPCSQCGQVGHNVTTCSNWMAAIDPTYFHIDYVPKPKSKPKPKAKAKAKPKALQKVNHDPPSGIVTMYHGTSIESAMNIQKNGFNVDLCGKNGAMLGKGVYVAPTLEKAMMYAKGFHKPNLCNGVILIVKVDLGNCFVIDEDMLYMRTQWTKLDYDSCYLPACILGRIGIDRNCEVYCIRDSSKVEVTEMIFSHSIEAKRYGYTIENDCLCKA